MTRRFMPSSRATSTGTHFRLANPPIPNPDKYADELLDAYLFVENADRLYAEYAAPWSRVHATAWRHALAFARICREGL